MIELNRLNAYYGNTQRHKVLDDVSLRIPRDQTLVLLGGSGAGKSTVLKAILRLVSIESGVIHLNGADITTFSSTQLRRAIGMVFQQAALFPHLNVIENIALPLRVAGLARRERHARARDMLALVGLEPNAYAERLPSALSGGQQQRVGVARALVTQPSYLLMDEPFSALDALTRRNLQEELKALRTQLGITILFVTHDAMEAASLGDAIAVMDAGRIVQQGSALELMEHPTHKAVEDLVSSPLRALRGFVQASVR